MKKLITIFPLVLTLCFFLTCQNNNDLENLKAMESEELQEQQNEKIIVRLIEELNKGNLEIYEGVCSPDYLCYSPSTTQPPKSLKETMEFGKALFSAFPDAYYEVKDIITEGDRVVVWNIFSGTHEKEYLGIPATGNKITVSSILIFKIRNGKIIEEREEADMLGAMMQLGMQLVPKK
jgi:steroid delta-isomerase-like uncharacterized protein